MFGPLGLPELLLIFVVALILFGPRRLPEIGRTIGKAMGEFKKATDEFKNTIEREVRVEELRQIPPAVNAAMTSSIQSIEAVSRTEPVSTVVVAEPPPHVPAEASDPTPRAE
jgi:TatA/E family protein of Tat protein translocase